MQDGCAVGKCKHPENVVYIINSLRALMPNKMISLTFPHQPERYHYYMDVITPTIENLGNYQFPSYMYIVPN